MVLPYLWVEHHTDTSGWHSSVQTSEVNRRTQKQ
jgi:hypothetical protein